MMKFNKTAVSILLAMILLCATALPALAVSPSVDIDRRGSLNVRILKTGSSKGVPGGKVEIYQITSVVFDPYSGYLHRVSSTYSSVLSRSETQGLTEMTAEDKDALVKRLTDYIAQSEISSDRQAVPDAQGNASFDDLELGLYLVRQTAAAPYYNKIAPFLITVPQYSADNSEVIYDVDAAPKTGTADPIPTPPPKPTPPPGPVLPQTGQLWWPVYALAGLGLTLFFFGWLRSRREDRNA